MARETDIFLRNLLMRGLIFEKRVCKGNPTSGLIFVPKAFVGKRFRVILIPIENEPEKPKAEKSIAKTQVNPSPESETVIVENKPMEEIGKDRFKIDTIIKEEEFGLDENE